MDSVRGFRHGVLLFPVGVLTVVLLLVVAVVPGIAGDTPTAAQQSAVNPAVVDDSLDPGGSLSVDTRVSTPVVPPRPDVVLLVDGTGSMQPTIDNVQENLGKITDRVRQEQPDSRFAVATYGDQQVDGPQVFTVLQELTDNLDDVQTGVDNLTADRGAYSPGPAEDWINALWEIGNGAGGKTVFREEASPVVVLVGDASSHDPSVGHTLTDAVNALAAVGARVIGVDVATDLGDGLNGNGDNGNGPGQNREPTHDPDQATKAVEATGGRLFQNIDANQVADTIAEGLSNLPTVVGHQTVSCDPALAVSMSPATRRVTSGEVASFDETIRVADDAPQGMTLSCTVQFLLDGRAPGGEAPSDGTPAREFHGRHIAPGDIGYDRYGLDGSGDGPPLGSDPGPDTGDGPGRGAGTAASTGDGSASGTIVGAIGGVVGGTDGGRDGGLLGGAVAGVIGGSDDCGGGAIAGLAIGGVGGHDSDGGGLVAGLLGGVVGGSYGCHDSGGGDGGSPGGETNGTSAVGGSDTGGTRAGGTIAGVVGGAIAGVGGDNSAGAVAGVVGGAISGSDGKPGGTTAGPGGGQNNGGNQNGGQIGGNPTGGQNGGNPTGGQNNGGQNNGGGSGDSGNGGDSGGGTGGTPTPEDYQHHITITVNDVTSPVVTVVDRTVEATDGNGTVIDYTATAEDAVDGTLPVTCTPSSGSLFPVGTTRVTCTATDSSGNTGTGTATFTVSPAPVPDEADLAVRTTLSPATGYTGLTTRVGFTLTNTGPKSARNVVLTTTWPATNVPGDRTLSSLSNCTRAKPCTIAPGSRVVVTQTAVYDTAVHGEVRASVTGSPRDPRRADNTGSAPLRVLQPKLTVSPAVARPGDVVLARGEDFPPGRTVALSWSQGITPAQSAVRVGRDGTFEAQVPVLRKDQLGPRMLRAQVPSLNRLDRPQKDVLIVQGSLQPPDFADRR